MDKTQRNRQIKDWADAANALDLWVSRVRTGGLYGSKVIAEGQRLCQEYLSALDRSAPLAWTSGDAIVLSCRECGATPGEPCRYPDGGMCASRVPSRLDVAESCLRLL